MNLTIQTHDLTLTDDLRAAVSALVDEGLQTMGAPPDTGVLVTLWGPVRRGARRHRAEAVVNAPAGTFRVAGNGLDTRMAVAGLKQAFLRQATHWRAWHEGGPPNSAIGALMRGRQVSERAMREATRLGEPGENPNADVTKRPHGYR